MQGIRGEYYGIITRDQMDEEMFALALKAIDTFKFPKISTDYEIFYAIRDEEDDNILNEADENDEGAIQHGQFVNNLTNAEINILIA